MDRRTVLINAPKGDVTLAATLLDLLAQYKGLTTAFYDMSPSSEACVEHDRFRTSGFWPSADFIMDLRPHPQVLDPEVRARGAIRSTTHKLLTDAKHLAGLGPLYTDEGVPKHGRPLTLIDITVASYESTPYAARHRWVKLVHRYVSRMIDEGY